MRAPIHFITLLLAGSSFDFVSALNDTTASDIDKNVHLLFDRAFPRVNGLHSTKSAGRSDAQIVEALAANGDKWLAQLRETEHSPPTAPNDQAGFLEYYNKGSNKITLNKGAPYPVLSEHFDTSCARELGLSSRGQDVRLIQVKSGTETNFEHPYELGITGNGQSVIIGNAWSDRDAMAGRFQFEDLITYLLAYAEQKAAFVKGEANIPTTVQRVKRIGRLDIENAQTIAVIDEFYKENRLSPGTAFHNVEPGSKFYKALIASNNGSLGPKFLGTNMGTLRSGSVGKISIRKDERPAISSDESSKKSSKHSDHESEGKPRGKKRPAHGQSSGKKQVKTSHTHTSHKHTRSVPGEENSLIKRGHASSSRSKPKSSKGGKKPEGVAKTDKYMYFMVMELEHSG